VFCDLVISFHFIPGSDSGWSIENQGEFSGTNYETLMDQACHPKPTF
jgi:hypothetical protein